MLDALAYSFDSTFALPGGDRLRTGYATGTESGSFDIHNWAFGRIHIEDGGISALLSGAGVDDSDHLLPPAPPARIRLCPLAASRLTVMAARSTFARAMRRSTMDSPAHAGTCGIQAGPLGSGYLRGPPGEFAVVHPPSPLLMPFSAHASSPRS